MAYLDVACGFRGVGTMYGNANLASMRARCAASQTIAFGDALIPSSGYVAIAASSSTTILGVALESVTTGSGEYDWITFLPALPGQKFVGQCSGTPTIANLFADCDLEGTTGIMEINEDATSYNAIMPVALWDEKEGFGAHAKLVFFFKTGLWNISA